MAIGFPISGTGITSATIIPDKTLNRKATPKARVANFGDGYQQRIADGINSIGETYSVNFVNREKAVADDLLAFFDQKKGVTSFAFTIPDTDNTTATGEKTIKVICNDWSVQYSNSDHYSVQATFERVYEP